MKQPIEYSDFLPVWKDYIQGSDGVFNVQMVAQHFYNLGRDTALKELSDEEILEELFIPKAEWDSYKARVCLKQIRAILKKASEK